MFKREDVETIMNKLSKNPGFFVSEAHLQMSFAKEIIKYPKRKFDILPEYPIRVNKKIDEIDLVIIDKEDNKKTFIEFKHKTKNVANSVKRASLKVKTTGMLEFTPSNMGAQNLGRFDCWSDIERLEGCKKNKQADNAFFIFVTNDELYKDEDGTKKFGNEFSVAQKDHLNTIKKWKPGTSIKSISKIRKRKLETNEYFEKDFDYSLFNKVDHDYGTYWKLIVEIK